MFEKFRKVASKFTYAVPVAVFLGFVFYITTMTYTGAVQKTVENNNWTFNSFEKLSNTFEKTLQKGIYGKYGFINLNGGVAKYLGFNSLNDVQKLANGYLSAFTSLKDVGGALAAVTELNEFLSERGIAFLYVLVPLKASMYDVKFAPGYENKSRQNQDAMVKALSGTSVDYLDMGCWFKEHNWHMEDVFFKTDHHWVPEASLEAVRCTMEWLQERGLAISDKEKLLKRNYRIEVLKDWFLGARGKRTGEQYAGLDDFFIYIPKYKTEFYHAGLNTRKQEWFYSTNLLDLDEAKKKDLFETNPYTIYMYGMFGFRSVLNTEGLNNKRLLIVGDSFKLMPEYFLVTQFRQVYTVDTRWNTDETLAQYIGEIKPDIVLMYTNVGDLNNKQLYKFGIKEYNQALTRTNPDEPQIPLGDVEVRTQENGSNDNFVSVAKNLKYGQAYTLTVDSTKVLKGETQHIQITLMNQTTNKPISNHYFEAGKSDRQKWIFIVPNKPSNYGLYLYAGVKGHTSSTSVTVKNILLRKGIHED